MANRLNVRATGVREVASILETAGNLRDRRTRAAVLDVLDRAAVKIVKVAKRPNYGFRDKSGGLRNAIKLQGDKVTRTTAARWVGVQGSPSLNYYSRAVEYRERGKFSYLRKARREIFNLSQLAFDIAGRLDNNLARRLGS